MKDEKTTSQGAPPGLGSLVNRNDTDHLQAQTAPDNKETSKAKKEEVKQDV